MTKKLTLTLDPEVIEMAKRYASRKGVSLSSLVEQYFKFLVREEKEEEPLSPWVERLAGSISLEPDFDYKEELSDLLEEKYK